MFQAARTRLLGTKSLSKEAFKKELDGFGLSQQEKESWRAKINAAKDEEAIDKVRDELLAHLGTLDPSDAERSQPSSSATSAATKSQKMDSVTTPVSEDLQLVRSAGFEKAPDGGIVRVFDLKEFTSQVALAVSKIDKDNTKKRLVELAATQDSWSVITFMLEQPATLDLVCICAVSLVQPKEEREATEAQIKQIRVMQSRKGTLQRGLVNLAGFVGLACAKKNNKSVQRLTKFIANPLLGEEPKELRVRRKDPKKSEDENLLVSKVQLSAYEEYKKIHNEMKTLHKEHFDALPESKKAAVAASMNSWFVSF